jgi:hypothetical protein
MKFEVNWYWKNDNKDENDNLALNEAEDDEEDDEEVDNDDDDDDDGNRGKPHPWRYGSAIRATMIGSTWPAHGIEGDN